MAVPSLIAVNLQAKTATGILLGILNIQNVTGSQGNDILVGDANNNVLIDKAGQNLIIGGGGADSLTDGGGSGDILISGTTAYDTNQAALEALLATWVRTDLSYATRVAALLSGVGYTDATGSHTAALDANSTVNGGPGGPK